MLGIDRSVLLVGAYEDVHDGWERLSRDGHIGMSDAFQLVTAAANTDGGRLALAELLADTGRSSINDPDALSYLRIARDLPLPLGVQNHRGDAFFRSRSYTGLRRSRGHGIDIPLEFLYFDFAIVMVLGTLGDVAAVRERMRGSGYEPVVVRRGEANHAVGIVMVNEFKDTTFGPYNEVIFMAAAMPVEAPAPAKCVDFVNAFSLQSALDRGAATFVFKLWLNQLGPIDGGNDHLATNKELGTFQFTDRPDGTREFRSWDHALRDLVSGHVPRGMADPARMLADYAEASRRAATPMSGATTTIPVASRPDGSAGAATTWAFAVDWRRPMLQEVTPAQVGLQFGPVESARAFERLRFEPALSFYAPSGVGEIVQRVGDAPFEQRDRGVDLAAPRM